MGVSSLFRKTLSLLYLPELQKDFHKLHSPFDLHSVYNLKLVF